MLYTVAREASVSIQRLRALMAAEHQRLESLMKNLPEGVLLLDAGGRIVLANPAGREYLALLTDAGVEDVLTHLGERPLAELLGPPPEGEICHEMVLDGPSHRAFEVMAQPLETVPQANNWVLVIRDITERKRAEEELAYMATHDALTGLPNRWLFSHRLNLEMAHAQRNQQKLAVMLLDLDHFKDVNDTLGHSVGDSLLQVVGNRLTNLLRRSDTAARMGGDEFTLLLPEMSQGENVARVAQKILEAFRESFVFDGHEIHISTSIGIALYPDDGEDADTLMKNADIAMYHAKDRGRDNYQHYTPAMKAKAVE